MENDIIKVKFDDNILIKINKIDELVKLSYFQITSKLFLIQSKNEFISIIDKFKDIMYLCYNELNLIDLTLNLNKFSYGNLNMINTLINMLEYLSNFILKYNFYEKSKGEKYKENTKILQSFTKKIKIFHETKHIKIKDEIKRKNYTKLAEDLIKKMKKEKIDFDLIDDPLILIEFNKLVNERMSNDFKNNINLLNTYLRNYNIEKTSNNLKNNLNLISIKMQKEINESKELERHNEKNIKENLMILRNMNKNFNYDEMKDNLINAFYNKQLELSKIVINYSKKIKNLDKKEKSIMTNDSLKSIQFEVKKKLKNLEESLNEKFIKEIDYLKLKLINVQDTNEKFKSKIKNIENKNKFSDELLNGKIIENNKLFNENNNLTQELQESEKANKFLTNKNNKIDNYIKYIDSLKKIIHEILKKYFEIDSLNNKFKDSINYLLNENEFDNDNLKLYFESIFECMEKDLKKNDDNKKIIKNSLREVEIFSRNDSFLKTFENNSFSKTDDFIENLKNIIVEKKIKKIQSMDKKKYGNNDYHIDNITDKFTKNIENSINSKNINKKNNKKFNENVSNTKYYLKNKDEDDYEIKKLENLEKFNEFEKKIKSKVSFDKTIYSKNKSKTILENDKKENFISHPENIIELNDEDNKNKKSKSKKTKSKKNKKKNVSGKKKNKLDEIKLKIKNSLKNLEKNELLKIDDFIEKLNNKKQNNLDNNKNHNVINIMKKIKDSMNKIDDDKIKKLEYIFKLMNLSLNKFFNDDVENIILPFEFFVEINRLGGNIKNLLNYKDNNIIHKLIPIINGNLNDDINTKAKKNFIYDRNKLKSIYNNLNRSQNVIKNLNNKQFFNKKKSYYNKQSLNNTKNSFYNNNPYLKDNVDIIMNNDFNKSKEFENDFYSNNTKYFVNNFKNFDKNNNSNGISIPNFRQTHCNFKLKQKIKKNNINQKKFIKITKVNSKSKKNININSNILFNEEINNEKKDNFSLKKNIKSKKVLKLNSQLSHLNIIEN